MEVPVDLKTTGRITAPVPDEARPSQVQERGKSAVLVAQDQRTDPTEAYIRAIEEDDMEGMLNSWVQQTTQDRLNILNSQLGAIPSDQLLNEVEMMEENLSGPVSQGNYIETIKSMPSSIENTEDTITREAVHMQLRETLSDFNPKFEEMDWSEAAGEIGGVLIPKRRAFTMNKLLKEMGFIEGFGEQVDVLVDPTEEIVKLRNMFWGLDDKGQLDFMNLLADTLPNVTDNKLIRAEIVNDIIGGDFNEALSSIFEGLDAVDVTLLATAVTKLGIGMVKGGKIINTMKRMKSTDTAVKTLDDAVKNPNEGNKVGVTQADVADSVNPLIHKDIGNLLKGASDDMAAEVQKVWDVQNARFSAVTDAVARHGVLSREEMDDVMRAAEIAKLEEPGVVESVVTQIDETGFKLQWKEAYFDTLKRLRTRSKEKVVDFRITDIGDLRAPVDEWVDKGFTTLDMNARTRGSLRQFYVSAVEGLSRQQEMTAQAFDRAMKDAFGDLDRDWTLLGRTAKRSAANVDHALMSGAKEARTYNFEELTNGVTGRALSPKEAKAYLGVRNVVEQLYLMKNKQIVDNLLAEGVKVYESPTGLMPVRQYDDYKSAWTAWQQVKSDSHHVLIPDGGLRLKNVKIDGGLIPFKRKGEMTRAMLEEAYKKNYVLARNHNQANFFKKELTKTQWALVKKKNIHSPRGKQVLNRIEGYMPKQRTGAYWFIKKNKVSGLSGADDHQVLSTEAWADTKEAAEAWKAKQEVPDNYEVVFDRELTRDQRMYDVSSTHGGMYAGSRKTRDLPYVGDGDVAFADSFEALQHYINHIGRQYPASLYRMGAEERLVSYARDLGVKTRGVGLHNILSEAEGHGILQTSREYKMLKGIHDQISFVNMIPTNEELKMANRWRVWGSMLDKPLLKKIPGWSKVPKVFYQKAAANSQPVDLIRGLTFNHLLGMYNPAQILVQFSGSLVSMAIDPIGYPKHVAKMMGWGVLDQRRFDPASQKKMIDWFKSNGMSDYVDEYMLWSKSGFRESVEQGNADYTSVFTKDLPYDSNVLQKVMENHTVFYKMGELANTRVAFATSIGRYKKIHKVDKIDPDDLAALDEISLWAEKYRMNMSRANQSALNRGWKAVPFQFQQVISKYFEKLLPQVVGGTDEFTSWEKARLLAIPTAMTGAVSVPFGQWAYVQILDMIGIDETELSPEHVTAVKHGAMGYITQLLGLNVNLSDRMTLGGDVIKNIYESLMTGKATWQWFGASSTVADRYYRNMQYLAESFDLSVVKNEDVTFEDIMAMPSILLEAASDIPTVSRNMKQYYSHFFSNNPQFYKDGRYMWDWETMNKQTAFFGLMGFQPSEMTDMYELNRELLDSATSFATFGDTDSDIIIRILNTRLLTGEKVEEKKLYSKVINSMLRKYGPAEQMKLLDQIWTKTMTRKFDQGNLLYKVLLEEQERQQKGLDILNTLLNRKLEERR